LGGKGNDTANFSAGFEAGDVFDGGTGIDTIGMTNALAIGTPAGKLTSVEQLDITTSGTGTVDIDNFSGVTKVIYNAGLAATTKVADAVSGLEVEIDVNDGLQGKDFEVDLKTDGADDKVVLTFDAIAAGSNMGTVKADDAETLTLSADDDTNNDSGVLTIASLSAQDATKLVLSGDADLIITDFNDPLTPVLKTVDATGVSDKLTVSGMNLAASGATVSFGTGGTSWTVATAGGSDTYNFGSGVDKLVYSNANQSTGTSSDTVVGFAQGIDKLDLTALGTVSTAFWRGNATNITAAETALSKVAGQAVFVQSEGVLIVDNGDGTIGAGDLRLVMQGVTSMTATDVGLGLAGNTVTLTAASANVTTTTKTNADNVTTAEDDTIISTIANLVGSTIDGSSGIDVLSISNAGAVGALAATITKVETLTLANGTNAGVKFDDAGVFTNVNGGTGADTIADTSDLIEGGKINLGAGNDTITTLDFFETTAGADTSVKFDIDMGDGDDAVTVGTALIFTADSKLNGGVGTDTFNADGVVNISAGSVLAFENLTATAATTMTTEQFNGFTGTQTGAGKVVLINGGVVTNAKISTDLAAGVSTTISTSAAAALTIKGNTGNDTVIVKDNYKNLTFAETAAGGTDTLNIAYDVAGAIKFKDLIEKVVISANQTNGTLENGADVKEIDASAATNAFTLDKILEVATKTVFGSGNDTITDMEANKAVSLIDLGAGNDTITTLNVGALALTVDLGSGNDMISKLAVHGAGKLTLVFDAPVAGSTSALNVADTAIDFAVNDVFDFAGAVTAVVNGAINGVNGVAGAAGQLFVETSGLNTILTYDADGSRSFSVGDVQITVVGNVLNGGITDGNFVIGSST